MIVWEEKTLNELGTVGRGKSRHRPRNAPHLYGGKYPLIQTGDVQSAPFYISSYSQTYSEAGLAQSKLWQKDTLCISIVGANTAATALLDFDACFPDSVIGFVPNPALSDVKFVKYSLELLRDHLKSISEGTARENLSLEKLLSIKIPTPSINCQRQIVAILSPYDDLIKINLQRIKLLEEIIKNTYEEWFIKFRINGKQLKIRKETGLPQGWQKKSLNDIADIISGFAFKSSDYVQDGQYKIVTIKNVQDGYFVPDTTDTLLEIPNKVKPNQYLRTGDIILSLTGNVGRTCLVYGENYLLNQRVAKIVPKDELNKGFVYSLLRSGKTMSILENLSNGVAQQNLSPINTGNMEIEFPPAEILEVFSSKINLVLDLSCNLYLQNKILQEARDILLPRLLDRTISIEKAKIISITPLKQKEITWEFKEAVLIAMLTAKFGNEKFPLGRKRYTKLSYLFHRHIDNQAKNYLRKAAGPYNPKTKYQGPEKIAHQNGYVVDHKNGNLIGFIAGKRIDEAQGYFENYWSIEYVNWLDSNFRYKSNDYLELYATVDNAMLELHEKTEPVSVKAIKQIIKTEKEWKAKLEREIFSDKNIQQTIDYLPTIFLYH